MPAIRSLGLKATTPAFQAGNAGFKSRRDHHMAPWSKGYDAGLSSQKCRVQVSGSSPAGAAVAIGQW